MARGRSESRMTKSTVPTRHAWGHGEKLTTLKRRRQFETPEPNLENCADMNFRWDALVDLEASYTGLQCAACYALTSAHSLVSPPPTLCCA